ncbi:MAG: imidazole glycerol-phosphate synthase subunit HisF [Acidobacteriota bacterium]|jgi:cyclase|nr:imidazole glycerol-phosphate synthase subunit HisF [Acidobacteriota bacterium]
MTAFEVIPSLDLLGGNVVRLRRGSFDDVTTYGDPESVLDRLAIPRGTRLHVVDLEGSRSGAPRELATLARLASRGYRIQAGGGVRSIDDARAWLDAGAEKIVIGTVAAGAPAELARIVNAIGSRRLIAAIDVDGDEIRIDGWTRGASRGIDAVVRDLERLGITELLATDIRRDGMLGGPSLDFYRQLATKTSMRLLASGGVTTLGDVVSLARNPAVRGAIAGRALLDGRITYAQAVARAALHDALPERVIPCLDVRDGRVVKGVQFRELRDAGDPVACARRYEAEGADELVLLDVSATDRGRETALATVERVAASLFIPLTVGGGVRTLDDFRALLRAGADRVAINTAAVRDPELIARCAREFGVQAVVLSCDARRYESGYEVMVRSGKESAGLDAVEWCRNAETLGAGEILLTSVDRDGTAAGFDLPLIRAVTSAVSIGVIASGGAGNAAHFREAIEIGGARAVLAASLFHDGVLTIGDAKAAMAAANIPVRPQQETQCST